MQTVGVKATSWSVCYLQEVEEEDNYNHIQLMQQTTAFSLMVNCCQTDTGLPCRSLLDETAPHPFLKKEKKKKEKKTSPTELYSVYVCNLESPWIELRLWYWVTFSSVLQMTHLKLSTLPACCLSCLHPFQKPLCIYQSHLHEEASQWKQLRVLQGTLASFWWCSAHLIDYKK